ncbi:MAG TPA: hypothetical protein VLG40_03490 [Candidatus Saccharimonas sp.]|nr:hypothetical protein [Candidatus Saccharimonas sp.]
MEPTKKPTAKKASTGYGKRPLWQWVLLYVVVGGIIYFLIYYFFFRSGGSSY